MESIAFYFDYISPYSYLAWQRVHALARAADRSLEPQPILFAALLDHHGQLGPAEIPSKRSYMFAECSRYAAQMGVPLTPPPSHPFNSLLALRVSSLDMEPSVRHDLIDALFRATWSTGGGVENPEQVAEVLRTLNLPVDAMLTAASEEAVKQRLRARTEQAIKRGIFGVPTMAVDDQLFWGFNSLDHLDQFLRGQDPLEPERLARFRDLQPSAWRRAARAR